MKSHPYARNRLELVLGHWNSENISNRRTALGFFAFIALLLIIVSMSGCVGLTGASGSLAATDTTADPPAVGALSANATNFTFGPVATGSSPTQTLTLTNTGAGSVSITSATITGAGFSVVGGMSMSLGGGQNQSFQIQFAPQAAGPVTGGISVVSNASNSPLFITMTGTGLSGAPPTITTQPVSQSASVGNTATFSVVATGPGPITYQWNANGAPISGATASSYLTPAEVLSNNGEQFTVTVTNPGGSVNSSAATLAVTGAPVSPSFTLEPFNQTVGAGQSATFNASATGTAPLTYQWNKNGAAISGATAASYVTPVTTSSDNGSLFSITVTNAAGSITSNNAVLTVNTAPSISTQPANQTVAIGQTATFTVVATGTAPLTYQWTKNGTAIGGATSASYTTPPETASDSGAQFAVTIVGAAGDAISNPATLTVTSTPMITTQPASQTITVGQTATFTVVATGTATLTYQWSMNGTAIGGATSASYTTPAETASSSGAQFTVTVTNGSGNVTSNAAILTVNAAPSITTQPASQTVTAGQTATFSVVAAGTAPLTYQWSKNGTAIGGATSASYTTPATVSSDNGSQFTVTITNAAGNVTSSAATLTVNSPPSITAQPTGQSVTVGQTATFSVVASGTATLTYQWSKNGTAIGGATSASYTTPATVLSDNGAQFTVVVTNGIGNATSIAAPLTVTAAPVAPSITTQPAGETVSAGQTATFSVVATGTATLTYQWSKNGTTIGGATSASYTTPATMSSDNGAQFTVTITNATGNVTSSAATLTVNLPPSITTQPASQTVPVGQTATFSVVAAGTGTLTYQWNKNGTAIGGATSASYTTPATTSSDNGAQFTVTITGVAGNVTSNAATLTVNTPPSITTQPANKTIAAGQTATFSVVAAGTAPLTYQWNLNGTAIGGATSASYTTPAETVSNNGAQFTVTITNSIGNVTSNAATLTVNAAPSITSQPISQTVSAGQTATFTVVAAGTAPLTYQWSKNGSAISGATSASYTTPAETTTDNGAQFTVKITNSVGNVTSNAATLTVNTSPSITAQPASQTVAVGQSATFTVFATGTAPLTYQWSKNGGAISGATSASYTTPSETVSDNGAQFTVTVTNAAGNVTSNAATLTVQVSPSITTGPVSQTISSGQTATFTVVAAGTAPLAYQWSMNGTAISGATSASYTTPAETVSNSGAQFTVRVTNGVGSATSGAATLTVDAVPSITTQPANQSVNVGQTATFTVVANGTAPLTYQWSKNGTAISGATATTYTTPPEVASDSGAQFTVTVTNPTGNVTSSAATLTVNTAPSITTQPASQTVAVGQTATFSVVAAGSGTPTYQWKKNGTAISGATSASYTTPAEVASDSGAQFTVTVTNVAGNVTSSAATLTVNSPPTITTQPASKTIVAGQTATFTVVATGTGTLTYQWNKGGTAISGATSASYTTPTETTANSGSQLTVTITNSVGNVTSNAATLTVNAATFVLNASTTSLNFNSVNMGSNSMLPVVFTNAGNSNVTFSGVSLSNAPGVTTSGVTTGQVITPGNTATLNVTFAPSSAGALTNASVTVTSNATNSPAATTLQGTGVQATSHSGTLSWTASTSTVSGYDVFRSTTNGGPYTQVNSSLVTTVQYVDSTVTAGTTYYYVVTAVNSSGVQSTYSNQVSGTIPTP